jgi:hypothetical protein
VSLANMTGGRDLYVRNLTNGKRLWQDYGPNKLVSVLT